MSSSIITRKSSVPLARLRGHDGRCGQSSSELQGGCFKALATSAEVAAILCGALMEKLRAWLMRRKFALQLERGLTDEVDLLARVVSINASNCYQTRLATLMHECGHVQIFLSRIRSPKVRLCGCSLLEDFGSVGRCDRRGRAARLSLLQEEIQAWDLGEDLAKRLSLRFTRKHLEKVRVLALMTYEPV